jgi:cell division septation protein DedD
LVAPQTQKAAPQPSPAAPAQPAATPKPAATQTAEAPSAPAPTPTLSTGSARVQLAAVKSPSLAKAQWAKLQKAYPELLGALTLNVEKVDRSGTTLYRVQAGPLNDKAAAKDLCAKLAAQKQACLVPK